MLIFTSPFITVYCLTFAFISGAVMGSAMNCLAWRLAHHEKWSGNNRSHCPKCGHVLGLPDLIPVFSWLFLRGRCRYCGEKISPRYVLTEIFLGLCFCGLVLRFDISFFTLCAIILVCCLLALSLVDLDTFEIPNRFIIIPAFVRVIYIVLFGKDGSSGLLGGSSFKDIMLSLWSCLWPALALGGGMLLLALFMDRVLKRESMGGGDIKLIGMLGLWFSLPECLLMLLLSCLCGLLFAAAFARRRTEETPEQTEESATDESSESLDEDDTRGRFPFGPSVALAALITLLCGSYVVNLYLGLFS